MAQVDEYGIPIKESVPNTDEYGIPIRQVPADNDIPTVTLDKKDAETGLQKNFEKRIANPAQFIRNADGSVSTHKMASAEVDGKQIAFPTIVEQGGKLVELPVKDAIDFAQKNGEFKEFKTEKEAQDYAEGGYKKGTPLENFNPPPINVSLDRQLPYIQKQAEQSFSQHPEIFSNRNARQEYYNQLTKSYPDINDRAKITNAVMNVDPYLKEEVSGVAISALNPVGETIPAALSAAASGISGGAKKVADTKDVLTKEGNKSAALNLAVGLGETALGVASAVVPELAAFNVASQGVQEGNPDVAKYQAPIENATNEAYSKAGIPVPKWKENLSAIGDFALNIIAFGGFHEAGKALTLKEVVEKSSPEVIKQAAEKVDEKYSSHPNEEKIAAIQKDISADPDSPVSHILNLKVDELHDEAAKDNSDKAKNAMEESVLLGAKMKLESQMPTLSEESKKALQPQLDKINEALTEYNPKQDATAKIEDKKSLQGEPQSGDQIGQTDQTGGGNSILSTAPVEEKITAETSPASVEETQTPITDGEQQKIKTSSRPSDLKEIPTSKHNEKKSVSLSNDFTREDSNRLLRLEHNEAALSESEKRQVPILRRKRDNYIRSVEEQLQSISDRYGKEAKPESYSGQDRQQWELLQRKLQMGYEAGTTDELSKNKDGDVFGEESAVNGTIKNVRNRNNDTKIQNDKNENVSGGSVKIKNKKDADNIHGADKVLPSMGSGVGVGGKRAGIQDQIGLGYRKSHDNTSKESTQQSKNELTKQKTNVPLSDFTAHSEIVTKYGDEHNFEFTKRSKDDGGGVSGVLPTNQFKLNQGKSASGELYPKVHVILDDADAMKYQEKTASGKYKNLSFHDAINDVAKKNRDSNNEVVLDFRKDEVGKKKFFDGLRESQKIAEENNYSHPSELLNSVKKRTGEEYNTVQEVPVETLKKVVSERVKEQRKQDANNQIAIGLDNLFSKIANKKSLLPQERTKILDDVKNVIEGIVKKGIISLEEAMDSVKEYLKGKLSAEDYKEILPEVEKFAEQKQRGTTHAETEVKREELGLDERTKREVKSDVKLEAEADAKIKEGYDVEKLADDILERKEAPSDIEHVILTKYAAILDKRLTTLDPLTPEFDKTLSDIDKIYSAAESGGSEAGAALGIRSRFKTIGDETLSDYFIKEKQLNKDAPLTDAQKEKVVKEFNEITEAKKALEEKVAALEKENQKLRAQKEVERIATKRKSRASLSQKLDTEFEDLTKEFSRIARGTLSAGINPELAAILGKMVRNRVEKGVIKLADLIDVIHEKVKEHGVSKEDILSAIAGDNVIVKSRNEIAKNLYELKQEAKLIKKYEDLQNGVEPTSEVKKIKRNQELETLRKQIKEHDLSKLADYKKRQQGSIERLEKELSEPIVSPTKKQPIVLDAKAKELKDKYIKLKQERQIRIMRQEYESRSKYEQTRDKIIEVANVPRTLMSSMDFSAPLRQGLIASIAHPRIAAGAGKEMFRQAFSQKVFDRWFHDVKEDPRYGMSKESGLYIADPHDPRLTVKEEAFMNNLAEKIPFIGKLVKGSERAYVGYLNKMRWDLFNQFTDLYESQGKTADNSPKLYKELAHYINNSTGRGKLGGLESAAPTLSPLIFAPRLIASRINMLSNWANPNFYRKMPKEIRVQYFKDMGKFIAAGLSVLALAKLNGAQVETDPRSADFGKIRDGNTRWDVWGGHVQYIRTFTQVLLGEAKSTDTGKVNNVNGTGKFGRTRGDILLAFLRGKLAPLPSIGADVLANRKISGEKPTVSNEAMDHLLPLLANDLKDAVNDRGISALFTVGLPSSFGVGVQTYQPKPPPKKHKKK